MKAEREKLMRAYLEVYKEFNKIYADEFRLGHVGSELVGELSKLFEIAMNDPLLGEVLKEEILQRYQEILEAEQAKQVAKEEAGEAMVI